MTKTEALNNVQTAAAELAMAQPDYAPIEQFRAANARLAHAYLDATQAGAAPWEINWAADWNGGCL